MSVRTFCGTATIYWLRASQSWRALLSYCLVDLDWVDCCGDGASVNSLSPSSLLGRVLQTKFESAYAISQKLDPLPYRLVKLGQSRRILYQHFSLSLLLCQDIVSPLSKLRSDDF